LNLLLVVLIVPFTMPLWDLVVYRTLGQYIRPCCLRAFDSDRFALSGRTRTKSSRLLEIARVIMCFKHVASFIVNANHSVV